jgi:peptidoglycan/LPS O-acetylase OafA/YrhL
LQHQHPRLVKNNFDLLRLLFAGTVCLVHSYDLSGLQQLSWIDKVLSPAIAVQAFFIVSGFLIFMSFERSSSFSSYLKKRVLRIYPAYFTVVMLCAVGLVAVSNNISDYFSLIWVKYVVVNLSFLNFLQPTLSGVFESNKFPTVNGALWTLKIEALFYLTVPLLALLFRRFSHFPMLVLVYCLSIGYAQLLTVVAERTGSGVYVELARQLPAQLCYFMAGAFCYYFLPLFERRVGYFLAFAVPILVINRLVYPLPLFEPFALASVVIFFGLFLYVGNFGKYGDFSYGFYILHFPTIQLILHFGWFQQSPWYFLITVIFITSVGAVAMWHLVEKRFLRRNSHYIVTTSSSG